MDNRFEKAVAIVLKNEGGYTWNKSDPGGETNYGISKRSYPNEDIKNLTVNRAKEIYYNDFWTKCNIYKIESDSIAFRLFDLSVNVGCAGAAKIASRGLKAIGYQINEQKYIYQEIVDVINKHPNQQALYDAIVLQAEKYYTSLGKPQFEKGWLSRLYGKEISIAGFKTTAGTLGIVGVIIIAVGGYMIYSYMTKN